MAERVLVLFDLGRVESSAVGRAYADAVQGAAGSTPGLPHTAAYVLSGDDAAAVLEVLLGPEKRPRP